MFRTDSHNNPTAFTVDLAREAGLREGIDFTIGDPFTDGPRTLNTARLIGDPIALTVRVIDTVGFRTKRNLQRWGYISLPNFIWGGCNKKEVIGWMYIQEGGTALRSLFA